MFFALVTRALGADAAAPIVVLWTYWGACTAFVTFPLQHWVIRTIRAEGEAAVRAGLRRLLPPVVVLSVAATLLALVAGSRLFSTDGPTFPLLVGAVTLGTFLTGVVRGGLAGRGRFVATAVELAVENLVRVLGTAVILRVGGGVDAIGIVLAAGAAVGLGWPSSVRFPRDPATAAPRPEQLVGAVAVGSALAQLVLVGGPIAVTLIGGTPDEVTTLFVTMALFRAPYLLGLGLANQATGPLTDLSLRGDRRPMRRFLLATATVTVVGSGAAWVVGLLAGEQLVAIVFGAEVRPAPVVAAAVAAGSVVAVGTLVLSLAAIGEGRGFRITRAWGIALLAATIALVTAPASPSLAVAIGFVVGESAAFVVLLRGGWRAARAQPTLDGGRPGGGEQ